MFVNNNEIILNNLNKNPNLKDNKFIYITKDDIEALDIVTHKKFDRVVIVTKNNEEICFNILTKNNNSEAIKMLFNNFKPQVSLER